jgi:hypothetical protein
MPMYGSYGSYAGPLNQLQYNLELDDIEKYHSWTLSRMRRDRQSLEALFRTIAEQIAGLIETHGREL